MYRDYLYNYLAIEEIGGTEFIEGARNQVESFGVDLRVGEAVAGVKRKGDGFTVQSADDEYTATDVVFATGTDTKLLDHLGCEGTEGSLADVDLNMRTSVENDFAVGSIIRDQKWEAVISAGGGGATALQIPSDEAGEHSTISTLPTRSNTILSHVVLYRSSEPFTSISSGSVRMLRVSSGLFEEIIKRSDGRYRSPWGVRTKSKRRRRELCDVGA